jgi:formyltetrahydrofolate deformylase
LLEAIDLHLNDEVSVHRGRTRLRDPEESEAQLGAPEDLDRANPDRPVDGLGEYVAEHDDVGGEDEVADEDSPEAEAGD